MRRIGFHWGNKKTIDEDGIYHECWYTDLLVKFFPVNSSRCCIAKYDGVPYFLFICPIFMFRLGKSGWMEWKD